MGEESVPGKMDVFYPLRPALVGEPPCRNAKKRGSFFNGILDVLSWPSRRGKSAHHRSVRKTCPQKLLEITDTHLGSEIVDHVSPLRFTPLHRSARPSIPNDPHTTSIDSRK
jgi:hypothetical protein